MNEGSVEKAVAGLLNEIVEDVNDPHFQETPKRWAKAYRELLRGQWTEAPNLKVFPVDAATVATQDLIFKGPLQAVSMCPHHVLPYTVEGWFAYRPGETVIGISKPGRLLEWCCARMTVQENLAPMFLKLFNAAVKPKGAILLLRGHHTCEQLRGARQRESVTTTLGATGTLQETGNSSRFMNLVALEGSLR